jgi:DNA-binding YbaB/EbfC family protein
MRRLPGMPGGMGDLSKLMESAKKMQDDAAKLQNDLPNMRIEAKAAGGMVTVTVDGHGHLVGIKINPSVADPADVELLEDLIITAAKDASARASTEQEARMKDITGPLDGLNLPPGLLG